MNKKLISAIGAVMIASYAGAASAAQYSWSFTSTATSHVESPGFASNVAEYSSMMYKNADGRQVTLSAFADTASGGKIDNAYLNYQGSSGLGVTSQDSTSNDEVYRGNLNSPQHSFDNHGAVESILFTFDGDFKLNYLDIGWATNDSDLTVYAFTDDSTSFSTSSILGKDYSTLAGWTKVGSAEGSYTGNYAVNPAGKAIATVSGAENTYSRYWLITPGSSDGYKDYTKLAAIAGDLKPPPPPAVPEPASLALIGTALAGMIAVRRRKAA